MSGGDNITVDGLLDLIPGPRPATSRNAIKSRAVASIQKVGRLREELLDLDLGGDAWATGWMRLYKHLADELGWLKSLDSDGLPEDRLRFLIRYGATIAKLATSMEYATTNRDNAEAFKPVGQDLLTLMALESEARTL